MIQLIRPTLKPTAQTELESYQAVVNGKGGFPAKVSFAKENFSKKNIKGNHAFDDVKEKLLVMCAGAERCHYCEDSKADEVEHILPKDVYPDKCYEWQNYVYACGNCNGPKNNQCAVINDDGDLIDLTPPKKKRDQPAPIPSPPQQGIPAIIDIVAEDPLKFLLLDLSTGSFTFSELPDDDTVDFLRAHYTLKILRLNTRAFLKKARAEAYSAYKARLKEYISDRDNGTATPPQLDKMIESIKTASHPTVWHEMKRQKDFIPELTQLFAQASEALNW